MPIISTDIQYRLSGGAGNTDVNASLGGQKLYQCRYRFTQFI